MSKEIEILSEITVFNKYAKHITELDRRETWNEIVDRNMRMHVNKYPWLSQEISEAYELVRNKEILPSMRSLQFGGKPIEINNARIYNCCFLHMSDWRAFSEVMFLLLCGVGVGFSVQFHHVEQLPDIKKPSKERRYLVGDSIEGWADAVRVLMKSYFFGTPRPKFDFRDVRPKGAKLITGGGKAPGPEPLKLALQQIQKILDRKENGEKLSTLEVHDINCFIADAVLSGGIRRSAMISLFSFDDKDMIEAKSGTFYETNPQRFRANNSAVIVRNRVEKGEFMKLWEQIEASYSGEPGFMFTNNAEWGLNPCAEISLRDCQFCNLVTINSATVKDQEDLNKRSAAAAFIATIQASYTDFHYLRDKWRRVTEKEALIGVSMTGVATGEILGLNMEEAANIVKDVNERTADVLGINPAARTTTIKPEGTTSLVLGTSSGVHAWHNDYYLRRMRVGKNEALYTYLSIYHPDMIVDCKEKPHTQAIIEVPQKAPEGAILRTESPIDLLERITKLHKEWIKPGHRKGDNNNNVSATVSLNPSDWKHVGEWAWDNRDMYTALSFFPQDNGSYVQAPFEDITKEEYDRRVSTLHTIDLTKVIELDDNTKQVDNLACAGGFCEIL